MTCHQRSHCPPNCSPPSSARAECRRVEQTLDSRPGRLGFFFERDRGELRGSLNWLSDMDSNHDKGLQRALCYRYTTGQRCHNFARYPPSGKLNPLTHRPTTRLDMGASSLEGSFQSDNDHHPAPPDLSTPEGPTRSRYHEALALTEPVAEPTHPRRPERPVETPGMPS